MNVRDEIASKVASYRKALRGSFDYPDLRVALLQLLRCVDYETFVEYIYLRAGQKRADDEANQEVSLLTGWGWSEGLSAFWGEDIEKEGIPLFRTEQGMKEWGDSLLQAAGRVRFIEHVLELERIRLGRLTPAAEVDRFNFRYADNATGVELVERRDADYVQTILEKAYARARVWERIEERRPAIMAKMERLVEPFENYYIRYDACPEVDAFYTDLSGAIAPTKPGWDAFALSASFGGIPFLKYIECVRVLVGFALKHMDFSVLLSNRNAEVKAIDILAQPCKWTDACRYASYALDLSQAEAEQVMSTTMLEPQNAQFHFAVPAGPLASHYMIGKGSAVRLMTGCLHNPFSFMLRELRRRFPADWDKSVDGRENAFRDDLIGLFSRFGRIIFFTDSVDIHTTLGKTDIDVFAFDPAARLVALFQLKWQDLFSGSMRERESRKTNFLKNGNAWVEKAGKWIAEGKMPQTLISLGMPKHVAEDIRETRLFVLGRNFSHFSGEFPTDSRAAWGSWPQVLRLVDTSVDPKSPLASLHDLLVEDAPAKRAKRPTEIHEIKIPGLTIVMHPPGGAPAR